MSRKPVERQTQHADRYKSMREGKSFTSRAVQARPHEERREVTAPGPADERGHRQSPRPQLRRLRLRREHRRGPHQDPAVHHLDAAPRHPARHADPGADHPRPGAHHAPRPRPGAHIPAGWSCARRPASRSGWASTNPEIHGGEGFLGVGFKVNPALAVPVAVEGYLNTTSTILGYGSKRGFVGPSP